MSPNPKPQPLNPCPPSPQSRSAMQSMIWGGGQRASTSTQTQTPSSTQTPTPTPTQTGGWGSNPQTPHQSMIRGGNSKPDICGGKLLPCQVNYAKERIFQFQLSKPPSPVGQSMMWGGSSEPLALYYTRQEITTLSKKIHSKFFFSLQEITRLSQKLLHSPRNYYTLQEITTHSNKLQHTPIKY